MSAPTPAPGDESPREGYYPDPSIPGYVRYWNGGAWVPGTSRPAPKQEEPAVVEETGPVFLDEEGPEDGRPEPATAWQADASHQSGFAGDRVSWGGPEAPEPPAPEAATPPAIEDGIGEPDPAEGTLTLRTRPAPEIPWRPPANDPFGDLAARTEGRPAPLGKRFVARLIDTVVLGALTTAAAVPLTGRAVDHIDGKIDAARQTGETVTVWLLDSTTAALGGALLGVFLVLGVLLDALPTAKWGRTLGKKLCGIDVRDIESHETPGFGAALRRWLVYGVLGILVVGIADVLWCLVDRPWRQCWHDKAARTFVAG